MNLKRWGADSEEDGEDQRCEQCGSQDDPGGDPICSGSKVIHLVQHKI